MLRAYCHPLYVDDIIGDLEELYDWTTHNKSKRIANWKIIVDVILLFRFSLIKDLGQNSIYTGMIFSYFKISFRNLWKHKTYAAINILGLSISLSAFFLISMYTSFEKSYDTQFTNSDRIYRLTTDMIQDDVLGTRDAMSFYPSGKALTQELPEVLQYTSTYKFNEVIFSKDNKVRTEKMIVGADSNFFKIFDHKVIYGGLDDALNDPYSLVLTASKAKSYFGDENPVGKSIEVLSGLNRNFKITAVIEDGGENTHYKFDILMSINSIMERVKNDGWNGFNYYTYLLLDENVDIDATRTKLPALSDKYIGEDNSLVFNLQPLESIHLYSDFTYEPEIHGSADAVQFLGLIALFVLIIAWVNYINLSTARALDRAKEVGLRKVIGAKKPQLIAQFLVESMIINFFALAIAVALAELCLPFFRDLVGKSLMAHIWSTESFYLLVIVFFLLGSFLSGFYPAFILSGFKPTTVLRGKYKNSKGGSILRKGLVIVQFAISLVLIASTFIVIRQVDFMREKDKGFDIDNTVAFVTPRAAAGEDRGPKLQAFKKSLENESAIISIGATSNIPGGGSSDINSNSGEVKIAGLTDELTGTTYMQYVDDDFMETLDVEFIEGRNFDEKIASDSNAVIMNQTFLNRFNLGDDVDVIRRSIQFGTNPENEKYQIVGIIKDFNRTSLKLEVEPSLYFLVPNVRSVVVKLDQQNYREGLAQIEKQWNEFYPNAPLNLTFVDQRFELLYEEDKRFGSVFGSFSVLAIIVSILGLFGLSSFMASQRTKEMGIRKVLGASIPNIVILFFKDFAILICISAIMGLPMLYFLMDGWLDNYAYRIDFPWDTMPTTFAMVLLFAFLTVGFQIFKVAVINPSRIMRYE